MTIKIKYSLSDLIGKTIIGIVTAEYPAGNPINRIFHIFSDGTALETWQDDDVIHISHAPDFGTINKAIEMLERREGAKIQVFRPPHEDPNEPQRDLLMDNS